MDMKLAQFWSGRSIPLGWTRWNPFWTLILVLMVAESAGEANGAARAADHGLSNIYSGTLRAARYGKRSTGEWERIQEEIAGLEEKERDADGRLRVANEELANLTQQLTTVNGEKAMANDAVNRQERSVNISRKVDDDPEYFTRDAQKDLDESLIAMKKANSTVSTLLADALMKFTGTAEYRESLETKYGRFDCARKPDVKTTLSQMAKNSSALGRQQNTDAEFAKATKEHDDLELISSDLREVEKAQTNLCTEKVKVAEMTVKLEEMRNQTIEEQKAFEDNVREYNKSLDAAAVVQEELDKINGSWTRANGEMVAATTELADVKQRLEDARTRRDNFVEETTTEEPVTGTNGTNETDVTAAEKESSGSGVGALFYVVCVVGGLAGLAAFCGLVYLIYRLVKCCRRKWAGKKEKKTSEEKEEKSAGKKEKKSAGKKEKKSAGKKEEEKVTADAKTLPAQTVQKTTTEESKTAADEKKTTPKIVEDPGKPKRTTKTLSESKGEPANGGTQTTTPEVAPAGSGPQPTAVQTPNAAQAQSAGGGPNQPVNTGPPPSQLTGDAKQGSTKEKEKKEGNAVMDDRDLKKTQDSEVEKPTQEETLKATVNGDQGAGTGTGGGDTKKKE